MTTVCTKGCYIHFARRVRERIGENVDPAALWSGLVVAIEGNDPRFVQCFGRVNRNGRRLWRFTLENRHFFAIFDHSINCPITVLPPDGSVRLWNGPLLDLETLV